VSVWPAWGDDAPVGAFEPAAGAAEVAGGDPVAFGGTEPVAGWHAANSSSSTVAIATRQADMDIGLIVAPSAREPRRPRNVQDPVAPNCDGVLRPDESLTNSSAGQHRPFEIACRRVVRRPQAPDVLYSLWAAGLGCEHRRKEAQDEQHRQPDEEPGPKNGHHDLPNRCVHATETPFRTALFRCEY
jgi:hypothetical protein